MDGINRNPQRQFDGKDLLWLIDEYMKESASRIKPRTAEGYNYLLDYFRQWWCEVGPESNWIISRSAIQEHTRWLERQQSKRGEPLAYNTIESALRRLRQVFRWAYKEGFFSRDYSLWLSKPAGSAPLRKAPDPEKCLQRLFETTYLTSKPTRNRALLAVLIGTAVRRTECSLINIEHIEFFDEGGGQILIPMAKQYKNRYAVFDVTTRHFIEKHIEYLTEFGKTTGPLFHGLNPNNRLQPESLTVVINKIVEQAGLDDMIHGPHDLRRMFATYWSRKQRGDGFAQPLSLQLGHTDRNMTLIYSKQDLSDVQKVFISPMEILRNKPPTDL